MNQNWDRKVSKSQLLGKTGLSTVSQGNKLSTSKASNMKSYKLENGSVEATRRVIPTSEVAAKTAVHPLNPRNQEALNPTSVANTLASIEKNEIDTDCLGIWSDDNKVILIIEGSVRRYCAIEAQKEYPVWVLPAGSATSKDIRRLINDAEDGKKPHSLREKGGAYMKEALELNKDAESLKVDDVAKLIGVGRETVRKALQAYTLEITLLKLLPDYEGVGSGIYPELSKIEKAVKKSNIAMKDFVDAVKAHATYQTVIENQSTGSAQKSVVKVIQDQLQKMTNKRSANKAEKFELASFSDRNKSAKMKVSADGRKHTIELSRIEKSIVDDIENFIRERLKQ